MSGWGLTTALSDWGLGGGASPKDEATGGEGDVPRIETTPASDGELDNMTKDMESSVTTALASLGFGGSASGDVQSCAGNGRESGNTESNGAGKTDSTPASDEELAAMTKEIDEGLTSALAGFGFGNSMNKKEDNLEEENPKGVEKESAAAAASSAIWSTFETVSEMKVPSSVIGEWIEDLQRENDLKDPHRGLRDSLDQFLQERPRAMYEEWVEHLLISEGWDEDSAVVDDSFYWEKSAHRNVWNERNIADGISVEEADTKRAYVAARDSEQLTKSKSADNSEEEVVFE